jgi:RNA polymerase sigma-70 factor (ECF subfamily)
MANGDATELTLARDRALVRRMLRGEEKAVKEFCDAYMARLYRFAVRRLPSAADADDVVSIVLSTAARRIETFRGDSTLFSWLLAICRHELGRHSAAAARHAAVLTLRGDDDGLDAVEAPAATTPEAASSATERAERVRACLGRLPGRQAEALELKYIDGYSSKEIAALLNMRDEAVQSLLARARRAFREECDHELRETLEAETDV